MVLIFIVQPDVKREREEDPNWRTDEHRKEDQHHLGECHSLHCLPLSIFLNLDCVGCPGQAPLPQFVQIGLNLWPKGFGEHRFRFFFLARNKGQL